MIRIYYWKDSKYMIGNGQVPTLEDFRRDYKLTFTVTAVTPVLQNGTDNEKLGAMWEMFNTDDNPLGTPAMQQWIGKELQPSPHTSMSTGDIVELDGVLWLVKSMGWEKLSYSPYDADLRPMPANVKGMLEVLKRTRASLYAKYPYIEGCPTKKQAIAKLEEMIGKGILVVA